MATTELPAQEQGCGPNSFKDYGCCSTDSVPLTPMKLCVSAYGVTANVLYRLGLMLEMGQQEGRMREMRARSRGGACRVS